MVVLWLNLAVIFVVVAVALGATLAPAVRARGPSPRKPSATSRGPVATTVDLIRIRPGRPADAPAIADLIRRENRRPADEVAIAASLASAPSVVAHEGPELVAFYGRPFAPRTSSMQNMLVVERHGGRGLAEMAAQLEDALRGVATAPRSGPTRSSTPGRAPNAASRPAPSGCAWAGTSSWRRAARSSSCTGWGRLGSQCPRPRVGRRAGRGSRAGWEPRRCSCPGSRPRAGGRRRPRGGRRERGRRLGATALLVLVPWTWSVARDLRHGDVGADVIALIAIAAALALGEQLAAAVVALMLSGGNALSGRRPAARGAS